MISPTQSYSPYVLQPIDPQTGTSDPLSHTFQALSLQSSAPTHMTDLSLDEVLARLPKNLHHSLKSFYSWLDSVVDKWKPLTRSDHFLRIIGILDQSPFKPHLESSLKTTYKVQQEDMQLILSLICLSFPLYLPTSIAHVEWLRFSNTTTWVLNDFFTSKGINPALTQAIQTLAFRSQGQLRDQKFTTSIETSFGKLLVDKTSVNALTEYLKTNQISYSNIQESPTSAPDFKGTIVTAIDSSIPVGIEYIDEWDLVKYPLDAIRLADMLDTTHTVLKKGYQKSQAFYDLCLAINKNKCKYCDLAPKEQAEHAKKFKEFPLEEKIEEFVQTLDDTSIWTYGGFFVIDSVSVSHSDDAVNIEVHVDKNKFYQLNYNTDKTPRWFPFYIPHFGCYMNFKVGFAENAIWQILRRASTVTIDEKKLPIHVTVLCNGTEKIQLIGT